MILGRTAINICWPNWRKTFDISNLTYISNVIEQDLIDSVRVKQQLQTNFIDVFSSQMFKNSLEIIK